MIHFQTLINLGILGILKKVRKIQNCLFLNSDYWWQKNCLLKQNKDNLLKTKTDAKPMIAGC